MKQSSPVAGVLAAVCVGALLAAGTAAAGDEKGPPVASGGKPKPAKVTLSHEARKVLSCERVKEDDEPSCRPAQREPLKSGAKVKLNPIDDGKGAGVEGRALLNIELDNAPGKQTRVLHLDVGGWELSWKGDTVLRDKFFVQANDEFDVALETDVGVCRVKGDGCTLDPDKRQQSIEIPVDRSL
jgi:hypothetical protein